MGDLSSLEVDLNEEDFLYEEELNRNSYNLRLWLRYIDKKRDPQSNRHYQIYERALKSLPGSYKLWYLYLDERIKNVRGQLLNEPAFEQLNNIFERALVYLHKMPRIWIMYMEILIVQRKISDTRRVFNGSIQSLPIMQHTRVWKVILDYVIEYDLPVETGVRLYRRYLKYEPTHIEEYIAYLKAKNLNREAAEKLIDAVNDDTFVSLEGKSKHQLWLELCRLINESPHDMQGLQIENIILGGIRKFTDEVGVLWTSLADYYAKLGLFDTARDKLIEGLKTVITVRDFTLIFDHLTTLENTIIGSKLEDQEDEEDDETDELDNDFLLYDNGDDVDLRMFRLQKLLEERPLLLNSVRLRQNPHNVYEWQKRVKLYKGDLQKQIITYADAVRTVDPEKALGKPHQLWIDFAKFYERHSDMDNARLVFQKASEVPFKYADDLAQLYLAWAEMEFNKENYREAKEVLESATKAPPTEILRKFEISGEQLPIRLRVFKSVKLWSFLVDLEESLGTYESTKTKYDQVFKYKIVTVQMVLNYTAYLQDQNYWEESFRVYEKGLELFNYPHVKDIWQSYLTTFVGHYKGRYIERTRELFDQAISESPPEFSREIYLANAAYEENYGSYKRVMEVYDRAVKKVPITEKLEMYQMYIQKAKQFYQGNYSKAREVYEMAIESTGEAALSDNDCKTICLQYAQMERSHGEIDRARAVLVYASALADPSRDSKFWSTWEDFEIQHGNEETFREMLRLKRSVGASFSSVHYNTSTVEGPDGQTQNEGGQMDAGIMNGDNNLGSKRQREEEEYKQLVNQKQKADSVANQGLAGFVSSGNLQDTQQPQQEEEQEGNPEEMDLDIDDLEGDNNEENFELQEQEIPETLYGSLKGQQEDSSGQKKGAMERLKGDLYQILDIKQEASDLEIKSAFRQKVKQLHPDVNKAPDAAQKFIECKKAYEILSNPQSRQEYNQQKSGFGGFGFDPFASGPKTRRYQEDEINFGGFGIKFEDIFETDFDSDDEEEFFMGNPFQDLWNQQNKWKKSNDKSKKPGKQKRTPQYDFSFQWGFEDEDEDADQYTSSQNSQANFFGDLFQNIMDPFFTFESGSSFNQQRGFSMDDLLYDDFEFNRGNRGYNPSPNPNHAKRNPNVNKGGNNTSRSSRKKAQFRSQNQSRGPGRGGGGGGGGGGRQKFRKGRSYYENLDFKGMDDEGKDFWSQI